MDRRIFKCPHCSKSFHCSSHLTTHVRTHTGEKPYQCGQCPKSFALLGNLTAHVRTHTGEKPYTCKYCTKSFTQSTNLNVHMRVHTGERPYKCQRCQKAFKTSGALNGHAKSCWKFLEIVSKHLPGFRRSNNVAASRAGIHIGPGSRGRGIKKTPVMIGMERNRISLPMSGTTLSKSSLHTPSEINSSQMAAGGNSNLQNYRKKLSIYFAKKRMNLASLMHSKSVNKPLGTNSSLAVTSEVPSSNANTVLSSTKSLDTTIKQEEVLNTLNSRTKASGNERENQKTNSGHSHSKIVNNMITWKKEVLPHKIISSSNSSSSGGGNSFDTSSNIYSKIGATSTSHISNIPFNSIESKNFNISDFSQPPQVRSDKESLTIDFNPVSSINKSPLMVQSGQVSGLTQPSRPTVSVFDQMGNNKTVSEISSRNINTLSSIQTGLSFISKGNQEKSLYIPHVSTNNNNFALTTQPMTFVTNTVSFESPVIQSSTETSNQIIEKKSGRNYFSDQQLYDDSTISNVSFQSTSDNCRNTPKYSQNTDYQNPNPSIVSHDSHSNFVETAILERVFRCRLCGMIFDKMDLFKSHMPLHEEDELLVCKFCELDFMTPLELVLHMKSHSLPRQMCELCDQMVVSTRFTAHLLAHAANMKKAQNQTRTFWCKFCDKTFNQQAYLDLHLRVHASQRPTHFNPGESKTTLSPTLQTRATTTTASMTHSMSVGDPQTMNHSSTQKIFSCLYCKKEFPNSKNLIIHMRSHAVSNPYKCKKCHQVFKNMIAYNTHKKSCFQDQKYELQECFSSSSSSSCTPAIATTITTISGSATKAITSTVTAVSTMCTEKIMNQPEATPRPNSLSNINNEITKEPVIRPSSAPYSSSLFNESNNFSHLNETSIENSLKFPLTVENSSQNSVFTQSQIGASSKEEELTLDEEAVKEYGNNSASDSNSNVTELVISSVTGGNSNEERMECGEMSSKNALQKLDGSLSEVKRNCLLCSEEFLSKTSLSEHLQSSHNTHELAACKICNKTFTGIDECIEHANCKPLMLSLKMKCEFCDVSFDSTSDYKQHKEQHHRTGCSDVAMSKNNDINEKSISLGNAVQKNAALDIIRCKICNKQFTKLYSLSVHMRTLHSQRHTNLNKCRQCERTFTSLSHLYVHHMKAHDRSQPLRCKYCKKPFKNWTRLKTHLRTHTGERPYQCQICPKSFSQLGNLTAHMRTHTGEKPYKCNHCEKSFTQSTNLNVHMRVHTNERPYQCLMCMSAFKTSGARNSHLRSCSGFKGKNRNLPFYQNRLRERQLKRKITVRKQTPIEGNLSNPSLISASSLEQDSLSNPNQLRDSDMENLTVENKLTNSLEENPALLNASPLTSTLQQLEKDDSKKLSDVKITELDNDFQITIESKVSNCNDKDQNPTIQGIYRNQFCSDVPSSSEPTIFKNISSISEKEATRHISMTLHSNFNENTGNLLESHKPISSDNNSHQVSYDLGSDVNKSSNSAEDGINNNNNHDDDNDDVIIDNVDSSLSTATPAINLDNKNSVEEFTNLNNSNNNLNSSNIYNKETVDIDTSSFEELPTSRFLFPGTNSELQKSSMVDNSTSLFSSQASLSTNDYTPSQTSSQFSLPYDTDGHTRSCITTDTVDEISLQSTNNLYSNQTIIEQNPGSFLYNCSKCSDVFTSANDHTEHMMMSHRISTEILPSTSYIDLELNPSQDFDSVTPSLEQAYTNQQQHLFKVQTTTMDQLPLLSDNNEEDSKTQLIQCKLCPKRFTKFYSLAVHMKTHTQQQQQQQSQIHTCKICPNPEVFLTAEALNDHLKKQHCDFPCSFCNKICQSSSQLETHLRTHTGEKPFCCPHCPKTFSVNCNLVAHVRIHTGERPFRCQYCDKSFTQATNLNVHTRIHTGERPYNCIKCKKAFRTSSALKGHVKCCPNQTENLP